MTPGSSNPPNSPEHQFVATRRTVIGAGGGLLAAGAAATAGFLAGRQNPADAEDPSDQPPSPGTPVAGIDPHGEHQAGVSTPSPRQAHVGITVMDLRPGGSASVLLADLGERISRLCAGDGLQGVGPANLTITVGIGPDVVRRITGDEGLGTDDLPRFAREHMSARERGGDLLLQVCAEDPSVVVLAEQALNAHLGRTIEFRWQVSGFRGEVDGIAARNLLGFHDGITVPRTDAELQADVWLDTPERLAGGTIAVVRLMQIDIARFADTPAAHQEAIIGRRRATGTPVSGGDIDTDPNLNAKSPDGVYKIAADAHVRRAHPLAAGADGLMLRRSYSYSRSRTDHGLIFISFQRALRTFIRTQQRMDEKDALMEFTTTTASGTFLILPGFTNADPLGSTLS